MQLSRNQTITVFTCVYVLVRLLSFLTWNHPLLNNIIALIIIGVFAVTTFKNPERGWLILVGEFLLDGAGHFFEFSGLILRTWFMGIFALSWLWQYRHKQPYHIYLPRHILISLLIFGIFLVFAIVRGLYFGHLLIPVLQDAMLYAFLLLLFPAVDYYKHHIKTYLSLLYAFIIGSSLFSLITLAIYASGIGVLPDTYYHWFRNVASGKITDLGNHFFRIVLPEHLLLVPISIGLVSLLLLNLKQKRIWLFLFLALWTVAINFTRMYFLALVPGFLILAYKQSFKRWILVSTLSAVCLVGMFLVTHTLVSRGTSFGLDLIGIRAAGVVAPEQEVSGAIRIALLPDIIKTIRTHPWLGSGLSTEVHFVHPITKELQSRTQFDWGYLELLAELGIIGTVAYLTTLSTTIYAVWQRVRAKETLLSHKILYQGLVGGAVSLSVINSTTPALFQGFGVLFFVFLMVQIHEEHTEKPSLSSATV